MAEFFTEVAAPWRRQELPLLQIPVVYKPQGSNDGISADSFERTGAAIDEGSENGIMPLARRSPSDAGVSEGGSGSRSHSAVGQGLG